MSLFDKPIVMVTFDEYLYDFSMHLSDGSEIVEEKCDSVEAVFEKYALIRAKCICYAIAPLVCPDQEIVDSFVKSIDNDTFILVGDILIDASSTGTIEDAVSSVSPKHYQNCPNWMNPVIELESADSLESSYSPSILTLHDRNRCFGFVRLLECSFQSVIRRFAALPPIRFHRFGDPCTQTEFILLVFSMDFRVEAASSFLVSFRYF